MTGHGGYLMEYDRMTEDEIKLTIEKILSSIKSLKKIKV